MSETTRYTVPGLGGVEVTALPLDGDRTVIAGMRHDGGTVPVTRVHIPGVGPAYLPTAKLEPVKPPPPAQPPVGAVVTDRYVVAWQHVSFASFGQSGGVAKSGWVATKMYPPLAIHDRNFLSWEELQERGPLLRMVAVEPVDLPFEIRDMDDDQGQVFIGRRGNVGPIVRLSGGAGLALTPAGAREYANAVLHTAALAEAVS